MADVTVELDVAAITDMLTSENDIVGRFLADLADQAATVARGRVPVRRSRTWSSRSNARPPGWTAASIHTAMGHSSNGSLWASANADADAGAFLEDPRVNRTKEPFLSAGLWSLAGTF